jgi:hypothetical protein
MRKSGPLTTQGNNAWKRDMSIHHDLSLLRMLRRGFSGSVPIPIKVRGCGLARFDFVLGPERNRLSPARSCRVHEKCNYAQFNLAGTHRTKVRQNYHMSGTSTMRRNVG